MSASTAQPLLFVPGLLCDPLLWSAQVHALADVADCWIADPTRHDSIDDMARDALAACPFERFSLAGLSMGGYVAQAIWRQAPERVQRLALLNTNARPDTPEGSAQRRALVARAQSEGLAVVAEALLPKLVWPQAQQHAALAAVVRTMARNTGVEAFARQQQAIIGRADQREALRGVACPTLVACGAEDLLTPPALHEEMAALIPGAQLQVFDGSGHLSPLEQPQQVSQALREWLQRS